MKLIRNGVFETNSSSAHSLAYKNEDVLRGVYESNGVKDFKDGRYRLTEIPEKYKNYVLYPRFDEYGWGYDVLDTPDEKLSYILTNEYEGVTSLQKVYNGKFFVMVVKWLQEFGISVSIKELQLDDYGYVDGYIDHESKFVIPKDIFKDKEDLITYLFNDDIVVYIENDNEECMKWLKKSNKK